MLRNDFPAPIVFAGESYASVLHGYWALSVADVADRGRIRDAGSGREAHDLGGRATHRSDWPDVRLAVMAELLRAKFTQHPELARVLLSTGDARISYTGFSESPFWRDVPDGRGRNWMGRLLELTRSELVARQLLRPEDPDVLNEDDSLTGVSTCPRAERA
ncbi:NADAR family protein [Streptomyces zhihengii]|uniref:NADAR family protein n=1 Tax=Streptomyces zhihengii TaxID=1818004 RepID=UPI003453058E